MGSIVSSVVSLLVIFNFYNFNIGNSNQVEPHLKKSNQNLSFGFDPAIQSILSRSSDENFFINVFSENREKIKEKFSSPGEREFVLYEFRAASSFVVDPPTLVIGNKKLFDDAAFSYLDEKKLRKYTVSFDKNNRRIVKPKCENANKIYIVGGISSLGLGLDDTLTFPSILQHHLCSSHEVINLSSYDFSLINEITKLGDLKLKSGKDVLVVFIEEVHNENFLKILKQLPFKPIVISHQPLHYLEYNLLWNTSETRKKKRKEFFKFQELIRNAEDVNFLGTADIFKRADPENYNYYFSFMRFYSNSHVLSPLGNRLLAKEVQGIVRSWN